MARDPNELHSEGWWEPGTETGIDVPPGVQLPPGVQKTKDYYAKFRIFKNGRRIIEWYKRGTGDGTNDPVITTTEDTLPNIKTEWDKGEEKQATEAGKSVKRTFTGTDPQTGRPATVTEFEDGTFKYDEIKPAGGAASADPNTPAGRQALEDEREKQWNQANGGLYETHAARREREAKEKKAADDLARQSRADAEAAAARNKPGAATLKPDGKGGTVAIQTMPDGTIKTTPLPGVPSDKPKPATITVEGVVYEQGADGSYAPAKGIPLPGATSKNIEPFTPDPAAGPDLGLGAWAAAQRAKIGSPSEAGGITQSEYDAATKAAHDQATVYIQNVTSNQTVRRQQEQDERTQRNDLSNQAAADYGKAQSVFTAILGGTKPGSRAIMDVIPGIMAEQARFRGEREGTARPATPLHPMFQGMPAAAGVTAPITPSTTTPTATSITPAPPNAIGLGNVGNQSAPALAPAAAPVQAAAAAPPAAPIVSQNTPAEPPARANIPPTVPAAPVSAPPVRDGWNIPGTGDPSTELGQPGDPGYGQPGMTVLPQQPNQMPVDVPYPDNAGAMSKAMPGPVSAWASQIAQPQAPASPTAQIGLVPGLQQQAQAARPLFDPMPSAGRLAQLGIPADAIAQALQELGLTPA